MLANGGHPVTPRVADRIIAPDGRIVRLPARSAARPAPGVAGAAMEHVRRGMYAACNEPYGTAYSTFHAGPGGALRYTVAGKTGTAETGVRGFDNAVFIGFAPYERPRIALAVVIPGGGHGSDSTGPVARALFDRFFAHSKQEKRTDALNSFTIGRWDGTGGGRRAFKSESG